MPNEIDPNEHDQSTIEEKDALNGGGTGDLSQNIDDDTPVERKSNGNPETSDRDEQDVQTPKEKEEQKQTELAKLSIQYPVIVNCIKQRFRNAPEDGEKVAAMLNKILNGSGQSKEKWAKYITEKANKGEDRAVIQSKIIPTIANACGVDVPRQVNDDQRETLKDRNGNKVTKSSIVIPEGFNQAPIDLGDQAISMDLGYPAINFNSELIMEILRESEPHRLKKLLNALIKRINGTPAGKAMLSFWGIRAKARSTLYKIIKAAATANGVPMLRRPLKASSTTLTERTTDQEIQVTPINTMAKQEEVNVNDDNKPNPLESIGLNVDEPLYEGLIDFFGKTHSESEQQTFLKPTSISARYLKHFYTILAPSGSTGLHQYTRYMSQDDFKNIKDTLGDEDLAEIRESNKNINDMIFMKYLEKTDGIPPFYILVPRTKPTKERLRICDDTKVRGNVCIKSIDGKNKAAYFMSEDKIESLFEAG